MELGVKNNSGVVILEGDIFDVHQTINGQSKFVLLSVCNGLDIRYLHDINYLYQYDKLDLINIEELEVVGKLDDVVKNAV